MSLTEGDIDQLQTHLQENRRQAASIGKSGPEYRTILEFVRDELQARQYREEFYAREIAEGSPYRPSAVGSALSVLRGENVVEVADTTGSNTWRRRRPPGSTCPSCGDTIEADGCPFCNWCEEAGIA